MIKNYFQAYLLNKVINLETLFFQIYELSHTCLFLQFHICSLSCCDNAIFLIHTSSKFKYRVYITMFVYYFMRTVLYTSYNDEFSFDRYNLCRCCHHADMLLSAALKTTVKR